MVCEEPIRAAIWHSLHHYAFSDAIFLAERLFAEVGSDDTLYLLATCYYQAKSPKRAYSLLQSKGCPTPLCRFLFAKCCFDLNKLSEGEVAIAGGCLSNSKPLETIASEFGTAAGYALALLGQICRKSEQVERAAECFKSSLKYNPYLWSSFEHLCQLGKEPNPADYFKSSSCPKILIQRENMTMGSSTVTMETTQHSDAQRHVLKSVASENLDPSQNAPLCAPTPTSVSSERKPRPRVGRNLLGATQTSGALTPSFGILSETPSPVTMMEPLAPVCKAPVKKAGTKRTEASKALAGSTSNLRSHSGHTPSFAASPHASQSLYKASVRRSSRLFTLNSSGDGQADLENKKEQRTRNSRISSARPTSGSTLRKTRRQTRSSTPQPLTPCVDNVIPEGSTPQQSSESRSEEKQPVAATGLDGLMSLMRHIGQAYVHLSRFDCKQALSLFSTLPLHHYNTSWVLCQVGRVYFELANYHMAENVFQEVRRLEPNKLEGMEIYSTTLWHLQKDVALSALAQELVEVDRSSPQAWCATGNCFSLQKEHDTAIKFFQRAVQVDESFTYAYTLLGHEYVMTEELERALSCYRRAVRSDARHYNAWYGIGMIYYKQEKFNLAEVHFRKALSINPSSSVLYCHIGVVQHALKKSDMALATLSKAMTIDPRNPLCKFHRASILFSIDKYQEALQELEELKKIVPREALVYFLIGKVYKKLGQTHLAQMNFSWAIDLVPKGANNQIKEAIDKRYLPDDDENGLGTSTAADMDTSAGPDLSDEEPMGLEMDSDRSSSELY